MKSSINLCHPDINLLRLPNKDDSIPEVDKEMAEETKEPDPQPEKEEVNEPQDRYEEEKEEEVDPREALIESINRS